jgi:hypothetical protein
MKRYIILPGKAASEIIKILYFGLGCYLSDNVKTKTYNGDTGTDTIHFQKS